MKTLAMSSSAILMLLSPSLAQPSSVDWKLYGGASVDGRSWCFYDAAGVTRRTDGNIRVWTKCLLEKDLDSIDVEHEFNGAILKKTAQKVARYYIPEFATIVPLDADRGMIVIKYEETANIAYIQPASQIFYELNCSERMMREMSISLRIKGQYSSTDKPAAWKYISPEGNGANLLKLLCPR
jgi:hypothetical protein